MEQAGLDEASLKRWALDPAVVFEGAPQSVFGLHEGLDAPACTRRAAAVRAAEVRGAALQSRWVAYRASLATSGAY